MINKNFIMNADCFGMSSSDNKAVLEGYVNGFLTSASLCTNFEYFEDAINKDLISSDNCLMKRFDRSTKEYRTYQVENGFKNYLLNENGTIIAKDINSEELKKYLN